MGRTSLPSETYGYDDNGRRVRKTLGTTLGPRSSYFVYQGQGLKAGILAEYTDSTGGWANASAAYTQGLGVDQPLLRNDWSSAGAGANKQFYHQDGLGSVIATTNQTGASAGTQGFDAWGNVVATTGAAIGQYPIPVFCYKIDS